MTVRKRTAKSGRKKLYLKGDVSMWEIKGYKVNHVECTIVITKEFAKRAGNINTCEYEIIVRLRKDNPTYSVRYKSRHTTKEEAQA